AASLTTTLAALACWPAVGTLDTTLLGIGVCRDASLLATATDFVNYRNNNWGAARLVVQNVGQFVFNFLLHHIEVDFAAAKGAGDFLLEVLANDTHKLFAVAQVNETAADDVGAGHKAATSLLHRQY